MTGPATMLWSGIGMAVIRPCSNSSAHEPRIILAGFPVTDLDTTVSLSRAATIASFWNCGISDSGVARYRVPIHTPLHPSMSAAAMPRPSEMPPAPITGTAPASSSTTCGSRANVPTGELCPPPS
jgi:hypothetical protein